VTQDSVDKFFHLEELINSRTPHTVGHISRSVEPQAAKIACVSTNGIVQECMIFYTQAAFLYSYRYEQQHNAYILVQHRFSEMHAIAKCVHFMLVKSIFALYTEILALESYQLTFVSFCEATAILSYLPDLITGQL